ncbi:MAG TPA: hypothetical protein VLS51_04575, partial [Propionibacteriaceae bacterium]|nr:hypothetical protein [Propionibacteriaceae bacterium]
MTQAPSPAPSSPSTDRTADRPSATGVELPASAPEEPTAVVPATTPRRATEQAAEKPVRTSRWVWGPIATYLAVYVALIVLGLTGSSTGQLYAYFAPTTSDPQAVLAKPRAIRSDEW